MARLHSCNVLHVGAEARRVWQFFPRKGGFDLEREQTAVAGQPLPDNLVGKSWRTLWQHKLNVAWLPPESVFLRVTQLPRADLAETRSMIELQLEKLSPLPVTHMVWGFQVLPARPGPPAPPSADNQGETAAKADAPAETRADNLQTVVVIIVAREVVEEFLGQLEKDGFLADRLEAPLLDQLHTPLADPSRPNEPGAEAWIYLESGAGRNKGLVAWWQDGVLQSLSLILLPRDQGTEVLREQFLQVTWAGELEGWLTSTPRWHLVADKADAAHWQPLFNQAIGETVKVVTPPSPAELAEATARRAAQTGASASLLPAEYTLRYHQQFVDRLWLRGLMTAGALYLMGTVIYFIALGFLTYKTQIQEKEVAGREDDYKSAIQLKARYQVLKDRQDLKFAALDCWKAVAERLPTGAQLNALDFRDGSRLALAGTAPSDKVSAIIDFNTAIKQASVNDQPLFREVESLRYQDSGNNTKTWNFACELNRAEETP
jgi:hypothetical protein